MTREALYLAIGGIDDALIAHAETYVFPKKKRLSIGKITAIAAGFLLLVGVGSILPYLGGAAGAAQTQASSPPCSILPYLGGAAGGGSGNADRSYMSYAGPIFPLSTLEADAGITAERAVNYDFSPYAERTVTYDNGSSSYITYDSEVIVTDSYSLSGTGEVTAVYPVTLSLSTDADRLPQVTVNGEAVDAALHLGRYTGGFRGVIGGRADDTSRVNLRGVASWEDFSALLATDTYRDDALAALPTLDQPVIVYAISDPICTVEASNPTLCFQTGFDYSRTNILTYGTNGGRYDHESGLRWLHYSIPEPHEPSYGSTVYLIVLGDDIGEYRLQGYADGGCDEGEEIEATATVTRYESTLGEMVALCYADFVGERGDIVDAHGESETSVLELVGRETVLGLIAEMMYTYGVLSDDPVERYQWCDLEMYFSETHNMGRIAYLTFPITIPAGAAVEVELTMRKSASVDFVGQNVERNGYDLVTRLGSTLTFTAQYASVSHIDEVEIISQNFGFDPAAGVTRVALDPAQPHYWMDVRKRPRETE